MSAVFDPREAVHEAARGASLKGSCNVLSCAFERPFGGGGRPACSMYCDEQVEALKRAYDVGRSDERTDAAALALATKRAMDAAHAERFEAALAHAREALAIVGSGKLPRTRLVREGTRAYEVDDNDSAERTSPTEGEPTP